MKYQCPICKKQLDTSKNPEAEKFFPFCCERCKLVDLGAWFDSDYKINTPANHPDDDQSDCQQ